MTKSGRGTEKSESKRENPAAPETKKFPRKAVPLYFEPGDSEEKRARQCAALVTCPELAAYRVINGAERTSGMSDHIDVPSLLEQLRDQAAAVNRGDLAQAEAMLMNQATALQSLFARLAERGMGCDNAPAFEANMRMALRAQSQSRATLETLAAIKNPPIVYARQANVTTGPQQVNNGVSALSQARENEIEQSKLMEVQHGERLDIETTGAAVGANQAMAPLGEIHRAQVGKG